MSRTIPLEPEPSLLDRLGFSPDDMAEEQPFFNKCASAVESGTICRMEGTLHGKSWFLIGDPDDKNAEIMMQPRVLKGAEGEERYTAVFFSKNGEGKFEQPAIAFPIKGKDAISFDQDTFACVAVAKKDWERFGLDRKSFLEKGFQEEMTFEHLKHALHKLGYLFD